MKIVGSIPTPGSTRYSVVCWCGFPFDTTGDNRGVVKCPHCKREGKLRDMIKTWTATPVEKLARLKDIAVEARSIFLRWDTLPDLQKAKADGKELEARLEEYYKEAQGIIAEFNSVAR